MPREFSRQQRIAEQMQKELARIIQRDVKDPRLGMITVNSVKVSKDYGYADVYVTQLNQSDLEDHAGIQQALLVLKDASSFLKSELGKAMKLRVLPQLRFHHDTALYNSLHISALISKARAEDQARSGAEGSAQDIEDDNPSADDADGDSRES
ncbi:30S ribosome-binding factor RbfA [Allohahella sp. A8]|uniref:30S ribosome-binding factor RbfA n=1 Tax=Allohahella sp. A8 TaxID=3141461 RepID=UPI000C0A832D|nr:ribosome-binding factor A [Hahellaceae bacterium]|tara:strand:+ start:44641 stop:45099 length:459 start_codon:yes stop_codon:yes gene_type:complete